MKLHFASFLLGLVIFIMPFATNAQSTDLKRDNMNIGLSYCKLNDATGVNPSGFGFNIGAQREKSKHYNLGMNFDFLFNTDHTDIDIANNLLSDESISADLIIFTLHVANRFFLNREHKVKLFLDANGGFRISKFEAEHSGYMVLVRNKDSFYKKTSGGLSAEFAGGLMFPFSSNSDPNFHLVLKSGFLVGTPVKYIKLSEVDYSNGNFKAGPEHSSAASYWTVSVQGSWRF